jgi:sec-independent protein translocase protein TatA
MGLGLGMGELVFVFLIILMLFGAKRLPEIGSSLGKGIREFKSSFHEIERELKVPTDNQIHRSSRPSNEERASTPTEGEPKSLSDNMLAGQQQ